MAEIDAGTYIEPTKTTLSTWLDVWIRDYTRDKKYSTIKGYKAAIKKYFKPYLGDYTLSQLDSGIIQDFFNGLSEQDDPQKILAPKTIRNLYVVLRSSLSQAVRKYIIKQNPCDGLVLPQVPRTKIKPLTNTQVAELLQIAGRDIVFGTLIKVIVLTGMREAEAAGLTWDCIDFNRGIISLEKQLQKRPKSAGGYTFCSLKNDNIRELRPARFVMDLLENRYREQVEQAKEAAGAWQAWRNEREHRCSAVFTNEIGGYLNPKQVYLHFKKMAVDIGAPNARVHDLRHTYAVLSLENGDDFKTLQENLGHASAAFTLDVYGHVSDRMKAESARRMDNFINNLAVVQ